MHHQPGMRRAALAACLSLTGILGAQGQEAPAKADPSVVMTDTGAVAGTIGAGVREHKGIPFAAPPVGELRWAPPRPAAPWSGVRDATRYRGLCPQTGRYGIPEASVDEDCLYLNVTQFPGFSNTMKRDGPALTQSQQALAAQMMAYWTSFARTGTPVAVGAPRWLPFVGPDAMLRLEPYKTAWFDADQAHRCGFWRALYPDLLDRTYALQGN